MAKPAKRTDTAIAAALADAGYQHPRERLNAIADQICARTDFRTRDAMIQATIAAVITDADLLWALFEPFANTAVGRLLEEAIQRRSAKKSATSSGARTVTDTIIAPPQSASGGSLVAAAGITPLERRTAQTANAKVVVAGVISKLDTFRINNRPIGDCTPEEIAAWGAARKRDARFAWLLANAGVPAGKRVRDYLKPEEANALYERAVAEMGNE